MTSMSASINSSLFEAIEIPGDVVLGAHESAIEVCKKGIAGLPAPLDTADTWIYCRAAWPHSDPDFEGSVFITLALRADHVYCQVIPDGKHTELGVFKGTLFVTDPLSLHWLAPNNDDSNPGFIGLQWEVPYLELNAKWEELTTKLTTLGKVRPITTPVQDCILSPKAEYVHAPPSPLT